MQVTVGIWVTLSHDFCKLLEFSLLITHLSLILLQETGRRKVIRIKGGNNPFEAMKILKGTHLQGHLKGHQCHYMQEKQDKNLLSRARKPLAFGLW